MAKQWGRREFLAAGGGVGLLAVAACSAPTSTPEIAASGPVTVTHAFGQTIIPAPPHRVVSAGYTEQDDLLAVGVVPIAVTNWFGDQPYAIWPWAAAKLGKAKPVVLNLDNGIAIDQIAGLKPDLIVATNAGLDRQTYQKLSAIAPTLAQSDDNAFFEPWKLQAKAIGQAVFHADQMEQLINGVDAKFTALGNQHPQFNGKTILLLQGQLHQDTVLAVMPGWRTEFLTTMGLKIADSINEFAIDHRAFIPRKSIKPVLDAADVVLWMTESPDEKAALLADSEVATVQAHSIFTTKDQAGAIAFSSPLSYPMLADQLPPLIAHALA
ncbi:MAG: ABC transporter substrate-binding protein [Mycobacteriaceae bacterium]|nr:ABC transporter substrate-binding protein [Mycobacteriaceae bacterium]